MTVQDTFWLNGHELRCDLISTITLDNPAADYDPTIVEDRADLYAVHCLTCRYVATLTIEERMRDVTHLCRNKRTGEWLRTDRTGIDDTSEDALTRILDHCQPSIVPTPTTRQRPPWELDDGAPLGYGSPIDLDRHAHKAVRTLMALGVGPWEAAKAYAASQTDAGPATHSGPSGPAQE